jgi:hypothetical protein
MEEFYGYIYKITCFNNLIYIGQHKGQYFDPRYLGSGVKLNKKEIKAKEIIQFCNKEEINDIENYFINLYESYKPEIGLNVKVSKIHIENRKEILQSKNEFIGKINEGIINKVNKSTTDDEIVELNEIIKIKERELLEEQSKNESILKAIKEKQNPEYIEYFEERQIAVDDYIEEESENEYDDLVIDYCIEHKIKDIKNFELSENIYDELHATAYELTKEKVYWLENKDMEFVDNDEIINYNNAIKQLIVINSFWYKIDKDKEFRESFWISMGLIKEEPKQYELMYD